MGGATNLGHYLRHYDSAGPELRLACLCDASAVPFVRSCLRRAGRADVGWQVCDRDLEDELIGPWAPPSSRRSSTARVSPGRCACWPGSPRSVAGRNGTCCAASWAPGRTAKLRYPPLPVDALDLDRVPPALDAVLG
jgi:hypothetical protein